MRNIGLQTLGAMSLSVVRSYQQPRLHQNQQWFLQPFLQPLSVLVSKGEDMFNNWMGIVAVVVFVIFVFFILGIIDITPIFD